MVGRRIIVLAVARRRCCSMAPSARPYAAIMRSLDEQITYLSTSWRNAPDGYPRLLALIALVQADLCIAGHERRLAQSQKLLAAELERQILPDGGHISRNPWVLVELLLDLLPLRRCFARARQDARPGAAGRHRPHDGDAAPPAPRRRHAGALQRHGRDRARRARHRAGLRREPAGGARGARAPRATCAWSAARRVVIVDAGAPPPLELAGAACAGCLSFEMSIGRRAAARQRRRARRRARRAAGAPSRARPRATTRCA